jgi:hypothetical protein
LSGKAINSEKVAKQAILIELNIPLAHVLSCISS